jgi:hypothetical protein
VTSSALNTNPPRYVWLNTMVGILDAAFVLTDEEAFFCQEIVGRLLDTLNIPGRGAVAVLPSPVLAEMESSMWSVQLHGGRERMELHRPRPVVAGDTVVSVDVWREALTGMLFNAYPDLDGYERLAVSKITDDMLVALGLPNRAARFLPADVVRSHVMLNSSPE